MTQLVAQPKTLTTLRWCLVGNPPGEQSASRVPLSKFPFVVGRNGDCDLVLASRNVSKQHAEVLATTGVVLLRDLGSTNGTFINGKRVSEPTPIGDQDLIQFADVEFRITQQTETIAERTYLAANADMEQNWTISRMNEVLHLDGLTMAFQPILQGHKSCPFAYEALARTKVSGLENPAKLFAAAESLGLESQLSRQCRTKAVQLLNEAKAPGALFVNTHPHEMLDDDLIESLAELRDLAGSRRLILEIHEDGSSDFGTFRQFRNALRELQIGLAFDDFGVGQSRLRELAEVTPDFLKFDRSLLIDLDAPQARHRVLVDTLHRHARELGILTVAEGLDRKESAIACQAMGFTHYQGFLFARPLPAAQLPKL